MRPRAARSAGTQLRDPQEAAPRAPPRRTRLLCLSPAFPAGTPVSPFLQPDGTTHVLKALLVFVSVAPPACKRGSPGPLAGHGGEHPGSVPRGAAVLCWGRLGPCLPSARRRRLECKRCPAQGLQGCVMHGGDKAPGKPPCSLALVYNLNFLWGLGLRPSVSHLHPN